MMHETNWSTIALDRIAITNLASKAHHLLMLRFGKDLFSAPAFLEYKLKETGLEDEVPVIDCADGRLQSIGAERPKDHSSHGRGRPDAMHSRSD